jgi:DHA1 family tetracycline resistance protein-like MFS transporter
VTDPTTPLREAPPETAAPKSAILFMFITVLMSIVGLGIIIPVMPDLIIELTGTTTSGAARLGGYLLAVYGVTQFFMSPVLGALSDRFGRRPVILTSVAAYAADFLLMAVAPTFAWLFIGRALSGGTAATYATANAFIADVSPPEKRAGNFGLLGAAFGLGFIVGPIVGGFLGEIDVRYPFYAAAAVTGANFVFGLIVLPESLPKSRRRAFDWRRANPVGGLISVGRHKLVLGVLFAYFLMQLAHSALPAVWSYFGKYKFAWSEADIGWSLGFVGVTSALVQGGLVRKVIPRIGELRAVIIGIAAMTASFLGYAFATPTGAWVYLWITVGAFGGFVMPAMQGVLSKATPGDEQGELQGAIASVMSICVTVSPLVMTQVFAAFTSGEGAAGPSGEPAGFPGAPFVLAAVVLASALVPFWLTLRNDRLRAAVAA